MIDYDLPVRNQAILPDGSDVENNFSGFVLVGFSPAEPVDSAGHRSRQFIPFHIPVLGFGVGHHMDLDGSTEEFSDPVICTGAPEA